MASRVSSSSESLGARIRALRLSLRIPQRTVTKRLGWGLSDGQLSGYERGHHTLSEAQAERILAVIRDIAEERTDER